MDKEQIADVLRKLAGDSEIREGSQFFEINIPAGALHTVSERLKADPVAAFDYLSCLTGVDYGTDLGVVYHIRSTKSGITIVLKTKVSDRLNPLIDSVTDIWPSAEYHEREVFDLLGIRFRNHPDLRRFFLPSDAGFPLRKDFVDDENIVVKK